VQNKKQMQENFHLFFFLLTSAQRLIVAPVAVTYNDKGGGKKGNHLVDIK
jgi:hypothetical protein